MIRLNYEYVKSYIEQFNYILYTDYYLNAYQKLTLKCDNGHIFETNWHNFKKGSRCSKCNKCKKYTYSEVKEIINMENYQLLSKEYINNHKKLQLKCNNNHIYEVSLSNFIVGHRCPVCAGQIVTFDQIKDIMINDGYKLISNEYINAKQKLQLVCPENHFFEISWDKYKNNRRCPECRNKRRVNTFINNYGVIHPMKVDSVKEKARSSLYKNNSFVPCSCQQKYVFNIIGGEINYPSSGFTLDIAFPKEKVYVECDFSGHWLEIKLKGISEKEFKNKQVRRWYSLNNNGWKEIRIISKRDRLPKDNSVLLEMIEFAKRHLNTGHSWIRFDIDENKVYCSEFKNDYNFGDLKVIRNKNVV